MTLLSEISSEPETKTIIFVETKRRVDEITRAVCRNGWRAVAIHGKFLVFFGVNYKYVCSIGGDLINWNCSFFYYFNQATKRNKNVTMY